MFHTSSHVFRMSSHDAPWLPWAPANARPANEPPPPRASRCAAEAGETQARVLGHTPRRKRLTFKVLSDDSLVS